MNLSDEDREALCICAEAARDDRTETETIGLCNAHFADVEQVVARHVAAALNEAADQIERELVCCDVFERLHGKGGLELTAEQKRERRHHAICFWSEASARIVRNLAANDGP